ncbi:hypothetical protein EV361DRAFT_514166 [Lentinula raphanica]|nr:hypothetical protein EV361DRAFT_514166 [Lentinula raphanica]
MLPSSAYVLGLGPLSPIVRSYLTNRSLRVIWDKVHISDRLLRLVIYRLTRPLSRPLPPALRKFSAGQKILIVSPAARYHASQSCLLDFLHGTVFRSIHDAYCKLLCGPTLRDDIADNLPFLSQKKVVSSGYDSDSSETSEGNDRPLKPSTPKSNSPDPYSMFPNALPPLRVEYRQPDDEHPVLEGVKGPEKPDEVVALFVGRRYTPRNHVSHRGIKFVESHPFHVLNDTFLWFQLFDDIKHALLPPCLFHCRLASCFE